MKLIAVSLGTTPNFLPEGTVVPVGCSVENFRGERGTLVRCDAANTESKDGKVAVRVGSQMHYNYARVWGLRVIVELL